KILDAAFPNDRPDDAVDEKLRLTGRKEGRVHHGRGAQGGHLVRDNACLASHAFVAVVKDLPPPRDKLFRLTYQEDRLARLEAVAEHGDKLFAGPHASQGVDMDLGDLLPVE